MPTAGRLAAAVAFAVFGWYFSELITPLFLEGNAPDYLLALSLVLGFLCGWTICGSRAGRGYRAATGNGLTAVSAYAFWLVFLISFYDMVHKSLRRSYDGPMEGVVDVFSLMVDLASELGTSEVLVALVVGGVVGGWFTEYFAKRFP